MEKIYSGKVHSEQKSSEKQKPLPSKPVVGAVVSAPVKEVQQIPDITPMRRGRPQPTSRSETPSKPVTSGDPFAALDMKTKSATVDSDDVSSRFPSLDQFSLLHDKSSNFNFDSAKSPPIKPAKEMNNRMAEKLADAAFASSRQSTPVQKEPLSHKSTMAAVSKQTNPPTQHTQVPTPKLKPQPGIANDLRPVLPPTQSTSTASRYVSTGTMTSDMSPAESKSSPAEERPVTPVLSDSSSYRNRPVSVGAQKSNGNNTSRPVHLGKQEDPPEWKREPKKLSDGQFGDKFKQFESNASSKPATQLTKTMQRDLIMLDDGPREIIGLDEDSSDDEDLSPEMRREMERLQLEEEERRVEAAQLEYRNRNGGGASKPTPGPKSASIAKSTIQNRVHALLSDDQRQAPVQRTAEGYGKYSDAATAASKVQKTPPEVRRKPLLSGVQRTNTLPQTKPTAVAPVSQGTGTSSAPPTTSSSKGPMKPPAPKKPIHLNTLSTGPGKPVPTSKPVKEHLIAMDLPGQPVIEMTSDQKEDYLEDFSKRFPSLSAMESSKQ